MARAQPLAPPELTTGEVIGTLLIAAIVVPSVCVAGICCCLAFFLCCKEGGNPLVKFDARV